MKEKLDEQTHKIDEVSLSLSSHKVQLKSILSIIKYIVQDYTLLTVITMISLTVNDINVISDIIQI